MHQLNIFFSMKKKIAAFVYATKSYTSLSFLIYTKGATTQLPFQLVKNICYIINCYRFLMFLEMPNFVDEKIRSNSYPFGVYKYNIWYKGLTKYQQAVLLEPYLGVLGAKGGYPRQLLVFLLLAPPTALSDQQYFHQHPSQCLLKTRWFNNEYGIYFVTIITKGVSLNDIKVPNQLQASLLAHEKQSLLVNNYAKYFCHCNK